ncbi:MAG: HYR domain-containing protein [Saprospiraceae bacterium]|nr:HYR domain-containing protein [Saprospiraceae bacterium]
MSLSRLVYFRVPLSMLAIFPFFLYAQNTGIFKTYNFPAQTSAMGEFNNGANFLINTCTSANSQATYVWTDAQGNFLNAETDFVGSCGRYRYDSIYYAITSATGSEPNRDITLSKISRTNTTIWSKTYPLSMDNVGNYVLPTRDKGFMIVGETQVANDTTYKVQLIKTDSLGNLQWQKVVSQGMIYSKIRRSNSSDCSDFVINKRIPVNKIWQTTDGGYYFEYTTKEPATNCGMGNGDGAVVVRLDTNGNYLWHKASLSSATEGQYHNVYPAENGNLLVLLTYVSKTAACEEASYKVFKFNAFGDTLWTFERKGQLCNGTKLQYAGAITMQRDGNVLVETQKGTIVRKLSGRTGAQLDSIVVPEQTGLTQATNMMETLNGGFAMVGGSGNTIYFYRNKFPTLTEKYCPSKSNTPWELWIANVRFDSINNSSDKFKDFATLGYSDYTNLSTTIATNRTYPLSITPALSWIGNLPNAYCRVWIDFNQNRIFEDSEKVLEQNNANPLTTNVFIPNTAGLGTTLMRVSLKNGSYPTACETFDKGEVEDYAINIIAGVDPCENDTTKPRITCPANLIVTIPTSQDSALVTLPTPSVSDACEHITLIYALPNGENVLPDIKLPVGATDVTVTAYDLARNASTCGFTVRVLQDPNFDAPDIVLSIATTPSHYQPYKNIDFIITAKNAGNQPFSDVRIMFKYPEFTANGGTATPSVGTWSEWCAGGVPCFTWSIPTLAARGTATLTVPIFVLNLTPPLVGTTKLLASTPADLIESNNSATVSVYPVSFSPQRLTPNPSTDFVQMEVESVVAQNTLFTITDSFGKAVYSENRRLEMGKNQLFFDVRQLPKGIYFIVQKEKMPLKLVKM